MSTIKRLQTYFAFLATLLAILSCIIMAGVGFLVWDTTPYLFFLIPPIAVIVFCLSLLIGYFIAEPLRLLVGRVKEYRIGDEKIFPKDGRLYEADELAKSFNELAETLDRQEKDLILQDRRQKEFVSDVAHELRTPLTAISGNAEMLLDPDLPPELHDKFAHIVMSESSRLSRLTKDLLSLQRMETTSPAEFRLIHLKELVYEVLDMLDPILREVEAHTEVKGEAPDVLGDRDRLKQVIFNLVENASRFIDKGGHITIELYGLQGNSIIAVKDDGTGFGDVDPKLLFDRFYRTDASRARNTGGTGLGLAIVKSVVQAHDGTVRAFNLPQGGACFLVALPSVTPELNQDPTRKKGISAQKRTSTQKH